MKRMRFYLMLLMAVMASFSMTSCGGDDDTKDDPIVKPGGNGGNGGGGGTSDPGGGSTTQGDVTYELSPTAVIVPESVAKQITNVDLTGHKFTLPSTATKPEVGQTLIINTVTNDLHDGLLAKVKTVTDSGSGYVVTYTDAELGDAFKKLDIPERAIPIGEYVEHVYDADGKEIEFHKGRQWSPEFNYDDFTRAVGETPFAIQIPEVGWPIGFGVEMTPKMSIDAVLRYMLQHDGYQIDYARASLKGDVTVGADFAMELASASLIDYDKTLLTIVCAAIPVGPVLITPGISINAVFKIDGKISLEASVSYKRTFNAYAFYQKGQGLSADCKLEPEAPGALTVNFGPKFEGAVSYGLSAGPFLGIYGKTFSLDMGLRTYLKESISGKLNLLEVNTNLEDHTPISDATSGATLSGTKWDYLKWDGLTYTMAIAAQLKATLSVVGKGVGDVTMPEAVYPIKSCLLLPPVEIVTNDFMKIEGQKVTLKVHIGKKSLFDYDTKYYAVWTNTEDTKERYKENFDYSDAKADLLAKDNEVEIESKVTLKEGKSYKLELIMEIMEKPIKFYDGQLLTKSTVSVSPERLYYEWEGSSQNLTVEKGGYAYYGVDQASLPKWLSTVKNADGTIAVAAQPNLSFENRYGDVRVWFAAKENPSDSEKRWAFVYVTQSQITGVDWDPKELNFNAVGGSQDISFTFGPFKRFGATVSSEGKGWCGVSAANGKVTITVQKNTSTEDRECIVNCYLTNDSNPTDDSKVVMPVKVIQKGMSDEGAWVDPTLIQMPREGGLAFSSFDLGNFKNLSAVRATSTATWLKFDFTVDYQSPNRFKKQIYISVAPNTTSQARQDTIKMLFANDNDTPDDQRYCIPIVVKQKAGPFQTNDLKSLVVGNWHHYIESTGYYHTASTYDLTINADGTYKEHMVENSIDGPAFHSDKMEEGTYQITGYTHSGSNRIQVHVKLNYALRATAGGNSTNGSRETTWEVYPHFMRYTTGRSKYYDRE